MMTKRLAQLLLGALLVAGLMGTSGHSAHAQSDEVKSAREKVNVAAGELLKIKQEDASPASADKSIEVKRETLRKVVAFTRTETESVYERLRLLDDAESELALVQGTLLAKLKEYSAYLKTAEARLNTLATIEEIQQFARKFQDWRAVSYNQELKKAIDMNLVGQNKSALRVVDARFAKINLYVKRIYSSTAKADELEAMLADAADAIHSAREKYSEARGLVAAYVPIAKDDKTKDGKMNLAAPASMPEDQATVSELVAESLQDIRNAYMIFLKLANVIAG